MSVIDKLRNNEYTSKLNFPNKPKKPRLELNANSVEARAYADALGEYEKDIERYNTDVEAFRDEEARLQNQFKDDLEVEYETKGNPKADLLWSKAWDRGHALGLHDVHSVYADLADLIK